MSQRDNASDATSAYILSHVGVRQLNVSQTRSKLEKTEIWPGQQQLTVQMADICVTDKPHSSVADMMRGWPQTERVRDGAWLLKPSGTAGRQAGSACTRSACWCYSPQLLSQLQDWLCDLDQ